LLKEKNIYLVVAGIEEELKNVMTGSGLRQQIGEQNIFYADNKLFQSTELALARAWSIVGMERRRAEPVKDPAALTSSLPMADSIMTRKCIRFGNQHQLREAVWLMSEMYRRKASHIARPLFLQDTEGRFAGALQTVSILSEMALHIDDQGRSPPGDDEELGTRLAESFTRRINEIAESDLPVASTSDGLIDLMRKTLKGSTTVIPVCDSEHRILGVVDEGQLIRALGEVLHVRDEVEGDSGQEIVEVES
jgi:hypothetical protein